MPRIIVKKNDVPVDQYIVENGEIRIGRTPDNDIVLNDPSVSRSHAEIKIDGSKITVIDLNSSNGTYVNGIRISRIISSKANVGIGVFQLEIGHADAAQPQAPVTRTREQAEATMMFAPGQGHPTGASGSGQQGPSGGQQPQYSPTMHMPAEDDRPRKRGWLARLFGRK